jgi:two-component system, response regulator PdtaR
MGTNKNNATPIVLIAEDEPFLRVYAADLLEEHGFDVVEVEDAATANGVMENRPDVRRKASGRV